MRILIALALLCVPAAAHMSPGGMAYEAWCCSNKDCAPVPSTAFRAIPGGWEITVRPGDHPMVTRVHTFSVPYGDTRPATDGEHHICLWPTEDDLRCVYVPPPTM